MKRTYIAILAAAMAVSLGAAPQKDAAAQMQAAINKQTVEGDLNGAIKQYAAIVAKYAKTDRATTAAALVRMAECYQAMGNAEAHKIYQQVVRDYADQRDAVAEARARLSDGRTAVAGGMSVHHVWTCSPGEYCWEHVSPDGRYLAFAYSTRDLAGIGDVAVRDLATGENRLLTHHAPTTMTDDLVWSPDGKRLAYDWSDYKEIRIINLDGSGERMVLRTAGPDEWIGPKGWSPDGKRILISRGKQNDPSVRLEWLDPGEGNSTPVKTIQHGDPAWISPDGRYIAFASREAPNKPKQVRLMGSDGSGETILCADPAGEFPAGWSPDGRQVIFVSLRGHAASLWAIPVANGKAQGPARVLKAVLAEDSSVMSLGVTRSGALYYVSNVQSSDIYTASLDPATGKATSSPVLLPLSRMGHNVSPVWSPDGHRLLTSWVEDLAGVTKTFRQMTILPLDSGKEQRLPEAESLSGMCWPADGTSILAGPPMTRVNLLTGEKKPLPGAPDGATCSADGKLLAFGHLDLKTVQLWDLEAGSGKELYRSDKDRVFWPAISPDGRQAAFIISWGPNKSYSSSSVMVVPTAGGPARELVRVATPARVSELTPAWSPDSRYVYFAERQSRWGAGELFRVPAAGGEAESTGIKMGGMQHIAISPDGTRVAFSTGAAPSWQVWAIENFLPATK